MSTFSILVVENDAERGQIVETGLRDAGYSAVTRASAGNGIAKEIASVNPHAMIMPLGKPEPALLETMFQLTIAANRPVVIFVDESDEATTEAAIEAGVSAYIVDGFSKDRIVPVLELAMKRHAKQAKMAKALEDAISALEDRKLVDKAKGILMKSKDLSEAEAYALMRRTAMNQNRKMTDVAQSLILASELLD